MNLRGWATAGSVVSAAASSACCWLPLLMVATGFSAVGAAAFFERFRLMFIVVAAALLAVGFYLNYRRQDACAADGSCSAPNRRLQQLNRSVLWFSAVLVAAFALFPSYVGSLLGTPQTANASGTTQTLVIDVEGMTCAGCEAAVGEALSSVPGVVTVDVSYEQGRAALEIDPAQPPSRMALAAAVGKAGYELAAVPGGAVVADGGGSPAGQWVVDLPTEKEGETTRLVVDLGQLGGRWAGEFDLLDYGVENYPVEAALSGGTVTLFLTAMGMEFTGTVSEDGTTLSGTGETNDEEESIEFRRSAEVPKFSEDFVELEAAADDPSLVDGLAANGTELRERFNEDSDKTRLLMLLSPT